MVLIDLLVMWSNFWPFFKVFYPEQLITPFFYEYKTWYKGFSIEDHSYWSPRKIVEELLLKHVSLIGIRIKWLKYSRYGVKHYPLKLHWLIHRFVFYAVSAEYSSYAAAVLFYSYYTYSGCPCWIDYPHNDFNINIQVKGQN